MILADIREFELFRRSTSAAQSLLPQETWASGSLSESTERLRSTVCRYDFDQMLFNSLFRFSEHLAVVFEPQERYVVTPEFRPCHTPNRWLASFSHLPVQHLMSSSAGPTRSSHDLEAIITHQSSWFDLSIQMSPFWGCNGVGGSSTHDVPDDAVGPKQWLSVHGSRAKMQNHRSLTEQYQPFVILTPGYGELLADSWGVPTLYLFQFN